MHEQLQGLLESGPWAAWKHRPGGVFLLRGDGMPDAERGLLLAAARAVLSGERGGLADQLGLPYPEPRWPRALAAAPRARGDAAARRRPGGRGAAAHPRQRPRRLHRRRARVRGRAERRGGHAAALGERDRERALRHRRRRHRRRLDLGREQPREPPHAVRQRPGERVQRRGRLPARRGRRRDVGRHAGPAAAAARRRPLGDPPRRRRDALRARRPRHHLRARGLRARRRAAQALAAHAHQPHGPAAPPQRLRLQRVGAVPAARRRAPLRGHRAGPARPAPCWRATPTTRTSPGASPSRTRACGPRRRPATGSSSSAGTARCGARPRWPARRCRIASAPGSTRARRCSSAWTLEPGETREVVAAARPGGRPRARAGAGAPLRRRRGRALRARGGRARAGTSCSAPCRSRRRTTRST